MTAPEVIARADANPGRRRNRIWIKLAGAVCLLSWVALAVAIGLKVDTATMLALATLAAVTTEGTIWLAALLLGVSAYQARQRIREKLHQRLHQVTAWGRKQP